MQSRPSRALWIAYQESHWTLISGASGLHPGKRISNEKNQWKATCGVVLQSLGKLSAARKMYEEVLAGVRGMGNHDKESYAISDIGAPLLEQGRLVENQKMLEQARDYWKNSGNRSALSDALSNLGDVAEAHADLLTAGQRYQDTLSNRRDLGDQARSAESQVSLATLSVEEGQPETALAPTRQAADVFRANKAPEDEATANLLLARILLDLHRPSRSHQGDCCRSASSPPKVKTPECG
jgi:tetratricopeptide (TPR) repeat protein